MNILLLNWRDVNHPKAGGAERVTMEHARGWVQNGHTVTWITSLYDGAKKDEVIDGVKMMRRASSLLIYPWGFFYTLFHASSYDIVIDEIHAIPFFTPLATRKPKIAFIHEIAGDIWDYMAPFPLSFIGKRLEKIYFIFYRKVPFWTDAQSTIEELVSYGIPRNMCVAIPCPISTITKIKKQRKKELKPTFLFVSRVVAMKGIKDIIQAFSYIISELTDAQLWIVGGGDKTYIKSLQSLIRSYNLEKSVTFWGKVSEEEKYELMARAHLLLHASVKEGWGLVVLESANFGTPSVVYNVSGLRDVVQHNTTGIVLTENNPETMAIQAVKLYKNKSRYKEIQYHAKKWSESFTWKNVIQQSEALLQANVLS